MPACVRAPTTPPVAAPAAAPRAVDTSQPAATTGPSWGIASRPRPESNPAAPPSPAPIPAPLSALPARGRRHRCSNPVFLSALNQLSDLFATMLILVRGTPAASSPRTAAWGSAYFVIQMRNSNGHVKILCYFGFTLPSKSRLTGTEEPPLVASPRHIPLSSFFRSVTIGVSHCFDFGFGLTFGETVSTRDRCVCVILTRPVHRVVPRSGLGRLILG